MRIALVHYSARPVVGGVETIVAEHARLWRAAGHTVTLVCGAGEADLLLPEIAERSTSESRVLQALRPIFTAQEVVILHNVLTMHFHFGLLAACWRLVDEMAAVRFLAWVHDLAACNPDYSLPPLTDAPASFLASAHPRVEYIAISDHRRKQFETLTGRTARVIPNGIDPFIFLDLPDTVRAVCQEHRLLHRDIVLFHPTRLLRRKNVELSLRVVAALREKERDVMLLVTAAEDPHHPESHDYAGSLRKLRRELALDRHAVFLHDLFAVTDRELIRLFAVADALFFPSRQEGFGLPLLEAALHRLPVFCADLEPMNALGESWFNTFDPDGSPDDIAELICLNLNRCKATQARKEIIRRYSWDTLFPNLLAPLLAS